MKRVTLLLLAAMLLTVTVFIHGNATLSLAQTKTFTLKFASPLPPTSIYAKNWDWWGKELEKRTKGAVKITMYHAGGLGRGPVIWENVLKGIADIGAIGGYTPGKHPILNNLTQVLPFRIPNPNTTGHIFYTLYYKGLLASEVGEYKFLWFDPKPLNLLATVKKKITKIEDFKGLRVRVPGEAPQLKLLGVGVVALTQQELYQTLERGMIDGMIGAFDIIVSNKLEKIIRYANIETFAAGRFYVVMNKQVWNSLPGDIQAIIEKLDNEMFYLVCESIQTNEQTCAEICKSAGVEIYRADPAELKRWKAATAGLFDQWVAEMEAKGLPGKAIQEETLKVLAQHGVE